MRASRLLLLLLVVQNRGRMTAAQLADELEVSRRTILRDVEALSEAGLPMIVYPGRGGGIELGFHHRTRLTGLASDEAEALGVLLGRSCPELAALGMEQAALRACTKLLESLPDSARAVAFRSRGRFRLHGMPPAPDERVPALAQAVRGRQVVRIRSTGTDPRVVHPVGLVLDDDTWSLVDALDPTTPIPLSQCGVVNISRRTFTVAEA